MLPVRFHAAPCSNTTSHQLRTTRHPPKTTAHGLQAPPSPEGEGETPSPPLAGIPESLAGQVYAGLPLRRSVIVWETTAFKKVFFFRAGYARKSRRDAGAPSAAAVGRLRDAIDRAGGLEYPVLLRGETGCSQEKRRQS